ncbi:beta-lactamase family protein [Paenibacillus dendritiformis]|uniref:serine hydrolase domain-containing protein n=1 Tax=Paenibacillus dendritiformis TaxID=130049 RepID=UPI00143DAC6B|nr:serine hydrolase domain-containing protein [Paenibacillus dendritiformis]NKI22226.1 beta-lactamase family protein [Paenibacillus dendritiformis]NRG00711.1 beta-lactamase family protein [Paenibacillus dendritiformis]
MKRIIDRDDNGIEALRRQHRVPGASIALICNGRLEWSGGCGELEAGSGRKVTANSLFHACSMSKMVTAVGVLRLVQAGVLELDTEANRYLRTWRLPDSPYTANVNVTLRHLLAHQSGIVDPPGSFGIYRTTDPLPAVREILAGATPYHSEPVHIQKVPGTRYAYSDAGYCVLEQLIEDVTGETFAVAMERLVMAPLGLKRTFYWNYYDSKIGRAEEIKAKASASSGHHQDGRVVDRSRAYYPCLAAAGLWSTPTELALLALEVMAAWNGDAASILRPEMARQMMAGSGCAEEAGLGVFVPSAEGEPLVVSQGWGIGFQCKLLAYPRLRSGIVVMTNSDPGKPQDKALTGDLIRHIGKPYGWPGL